MCVLCVCVRERERVSEGERERVSEGERERERECGSNIIGIKRYTCCKTTEL